MTCDIAVIGAGMAGASIAAELASLAGPGTGVLLIEAERQPGYHTTGRSAAFWEECYGGPPIVPLTLASGPYLRDGGFLTTRGALYVARAGAEAEVSAFVDRFAGTGVQIEVLDRARLAPMIPGLRSGWDLAIHEPACADIDVAGLHAHYLALARDGGVALRAASRIAAMERDGEGWRLVTEDGTVINAGVVVNAAGAWADSIAALAGAHAFGIQPLRRTVAQLRTDPPAPATLPLVLDLAGRFYFKPESGRLWLSPHDETPSDPCDAAAEELDVALAIDRLEHVVDWQVQAVERRWAGLRSFAPDRRPVYGWDPRVPGFFWFAGQGGFGIQTAPAAARLGAQLLLGHGRDTMTETLDHALYAPDRFADTATTKRV
ncbi:NAD(P)/FAD-dependent oxidoreductase [Croceibacterium mercuriale]|uniref:NAD(P)/FAD-dependent oxidoreductase n=1 Tax=Croceibacterium mercuriale TaxID=1572751 RepID=UPI00126A2A15|nr:FAD-dependent oxidoreductase [Croceibacterium mercuriale]